MKTGKESGPTRPVSMAIALSALDEERSNAIGLLGLLEIRPLYSVASDLFSSRFAAVRAAIEGVMAHEECFLREYPVSDETARLHIADHERIRTILHHIHQNSIDKKNQTALDVYTYLRAEVERHVSTFGCEMSKHIQLSETTINAVEMR